MALPSPRKWEVGTNVFESPPSCVNGRSTQGGTMGFVCGGFETSGVFFLFRRGSCPSQGRGSWEERAGAPLGCNRVLRTGRGRIWAG